jgi:hypothetical protein
VTWLFSSCRGFTPGQTHRALLVSTVCILLSASFLLYLRTSGGSGHFGIPYPRGSSHNPPGRHGARDQAVLRGNIAEVSDAYVGILLWPEKQRSTQLIAPLPISFKQHLFGDNRVNPLLIPFDGVYWFYKAPDAQPPATSREAHGSPEMFSIRSTTVTHSEWKHTKISAS